MYGGRSRAPPQGQQGLAGLTAWAHTCCQVCLLACTVLKGAFLQADAHTKGLARSAPCAAGARLSCLVYGALHVLNHTVLSGPAGKKQFTIKLAGEYDEAAVRAKVDGLIKDNKVGALQAVVPSINRSCIATFWPANAQAASWQAPVLAVEAASGVAVVNGLFSQHRIRLPQSLSLRRLSPTGHGLQLERLPLLVR